MADHNDRRPFKAKAVAYLLRAELHLQPGTQKLLLTTSGLTVLAVAWCAGHRIWPPALRRFVTAREPIPSKTSSMTVDVWTPICLATPDRKHA